METARLKVKQVVLPSREGTFRVKRMLFLQVKQLVLLLFQAFQCEMPRAHARIYPKENIVHPCTPCTQVRGCGGTKVRGTRIVKRRYSGQIDWRKVISHPRTSVPSYPRKREIWVHGVHGCTVFSFSYIARTRAHR